MVFRPIDLYVITSTFLRFLRFFFNIQKTWLFTFFAVFHTFSRTMLPDMHTPAHTKQFDAGSVLMLAMTCIRGLLNDMRYINSRFTYLLYLLIYKDFIPHRQYGSGHRDVHRNHVILDQDCTAREIWSSIHDRALWRSLRPSTVTCYTVAFTKMQRFVNTPHSRARDVVYSFYSAVKISR